ncbi:MAG: AMP-binding protein [Hamadaea sp.]|nr:AMP-binding protein [Hamadaea sp.]
MVDLVRVTAERLPGHVAVRSGRDCLTYGQLWEEAGRVASTLKTLSRPARRVGLYGERDDCRTYATYLGILRAAASVVPLGADFPPARVRSIIKAADLDAVLSESDPSPQILAELAEHNVTILIGRSDEGRMELARPAGTPDMSEEDPAYILFTSGSTGEPKGVAQSHQAAVAYVQHVVERLEMSADSRVAQTFDLTFDPSVHSIFTAWAAGATLVVCDRVDIMRPAPFAQRHAITHWTAVPSTISMAKRLGQLTPNCLPSLRWSVFGGEQLTIEQAAAWGAAAPGSIIENTYGPTEMTIACASYRLPPSITEWPKTSNGTVPIGTVHARQEHILLDEGKVVDVEGELCLRGIQRFAGYLDDAQNLGSFIRLTGGQSQPFTGRHPVPPEYWYRTGDRVRYEAGLLVHHGRLDRQVKILGHRIELGEIEACLRNLPFIDEAVVLAVGDGQKVLLCGLFTGVEPPENEIQDALRKKLPGYMIPQRLIWMSQMPLTANGKVDMAELAVLASAERNRR